MEPIQSPSFHYDEALDICIFCTIFKKNLTVLRTMIFERLVSNAYQRSRCYSIDSGWKLEIMLDAIYKVVDKMEKDSREVRSLLESQNPREDRQLGPNTELEKCAGPTLQDALNFLNSFVEDLD